MDGVAGSRVQPGEGGSGAPNGGESIGEAGQGGSPIVDPLLSLDLRGSCHGSIPSGEGQTDTLAVLQAYDLTAYGAEVGHHCGEDQGRFVYLEIAGDFDVAAQVTSMDNSGAPPGTLGNPVKAGLMMREGLEPTARFVAIIAVQPKLDFPDCFVFDNRSKTGGALGTGGFEYAWLNRNDAIFGRTLPNIWVRLIRVGRTLFAFASEDGNNWIPTSRASFATDIGPKVYLGMVASSAEETGNNVRSVTSFRNLRGFDALVGSSH